MKNYLLTLLLIINLVSCTEEISEEVKSSGDDLTETEAELDSFAGKGLRLNNTADSNLSYLLHKEGSVSEACELKSPSLGFSSLDYDKTSDAYTIDCLLDVQEFDLYFYGASLELEVDSQLCEYVEYKPYRFLRFQPGRSTRTQYQVSCDTTCSENTTLQNFCGRSFETTGVVHSPYNATFLNSALTAVDTSTLTFSIDLLDSGVTSIFKNSVGSGLECKYDYTDALADGSGPNCDPGSITTVPVYINSVEVSSCSAGGYSTQIACEGAGETWETNNVCNSTVNPKFQIDLDNSTEADCGGNLHNCLDGPATDLYQANLQSEVISNTDSSSFNYPISIEAPFQKNYLSNMYAANFSRVCSSTSNVKTNTLFDSSLFLIEGDEIEDMPSKSSYSGYTVDDNGDGYNDGIAYGNHMFNGRAFYSQPNKNIQPYYSIRCLDQAFDVKAQIRLFIREWDRTFDENNPYISRLSDINQSVPLMDATGEQDVGENWNDINDLDDLFSNYDLDPESDYNGDADNNDEAFNNNQCKELKVGVCLLESTTSNVDPESDCANIAYIPTGASSTGVWANRKCIYQLDTYVDEQTCEDNSGTWKLDYCSDLNYFNEVDCEAASETWYSGNLIFPGANL